MDISDFIIPMIFLITLGLLNIIYKIICSVTSLKKHKDMFWYLFVLSWIIAYLPIWKIYNLLN